MGAPPLHPGRALPHTPAGGTPFPLQPPWKGDSPSPGQARGCVEEIHYGGEPTPLHNSARQVEGIRYGGVGVARRYPSVADSPGATMHGCGRNRLALRSAKTRVTTHRTRGRAVALPGGL